MDPQPIIEQTYKPIVEQIYNREDERNREEKPRFYDKRSGEGILFIFRGRQAESSSEAFKAFEALNTLASERVEVIRQDVVSHRLPDWHFDEHVPHVTAAAIVDPLQGNHISLPEEDRDLPWLSLEVSFAALARNFTPFTLTFDRLHIGPRGTISVVAWPDSEDVGRWKRLMFYLFKAERWWEYELETGKVLDHSCQAVIGRLKPPPPFDDCPNLPSSFLKEMQNDLGKMKFSKKIKVNGIWLVRYKNRRIDPDQDLDKEKYFPFREVIPEI
jgi:hypothetical protein